MRYKYRHILQECHRVYLDITVMNIGHSLYDWNWTSGEFLIDLSKDYSIFSNESIILQLRRVVAILVTTFEQMPLTRLVVVNSKPGKMSLNALHIFSQFLEKKTEFYMLRYLPGTFTNGLIMYNYWYRKLYKRIKNEASRRWRDFNRSTMIKISWEPDMVVLLGAAHESANLAREVEDMLIPSIVLLDSNTAPIGATYPIRGSDDNTQIFRYLLTLLGTCIGFGKELAFYMFEKYFDLDTAFRSTNLIDLTAGTKSRLLAKYKETIKKFLKKVKKSLKPIHRDNVKWRNDAVKYVHEFEKKKIKKMQKYRIRNFVKRFKVLASALPAYGLRTEVLKKADWFRYSIERTSFLTTDKRVHFATDVKDSLHLTFAILKKMRKLDTTTKHFKKKAKCMR